MSRRVPGLLDARPWVGRPGAGRLPHGCHRAAGRSLDDSDGLHVAHPPSPGLRRSRYMWVPYPSWLSPGDNAWQMTAATLVGLMSVPGLVVLYGGVMQKRWSVNSMMMAFIAFALVLLVWVLYGYKLGFGSPMHIFGASHGFFANMWG